jgi:hypothetical protein
VALRWLVDVLGLPPDTQGAFVTGATMANFTALAAARHAVLKRAGIDADNASPEVLAQAFREIGSRFDDAAARTTVQIDQPFYDAVQAAHRDYGRRLPTDVAPTFNSYMDDIAAMQSAGAQPGVTGTAIDGPAFQNVYSNLRRAARTSKARPELQEALNSLADAFDDAMVRTGRSNGLPLPPGAPIPPGTNPVDDWVSARHDYRNLLPVDNAMATSQAGAIAGDIPPSRLFNEVMRQQGKKGMTTGQGELNDLARVGTAFVRDNIPDSGTAQRMLMQNLLTGGTAGGAGYMASGDPTAALAFAGAGLAGPRLAQMLYNSGPVRNYLSNTALDKVAAEQTRRSLAQLLAGGTGTYSGVQSQRP